MWCSQTDVINNDGADKNFAIIDTRNSGFQVKYLHCFNKTVIFKLILKWTCIKKKIRCFILINTALSCDN